MEVRKPNKISHKFEQTINGSINKIMPLYCPVREIDWVEGWNPKVVISNSGLVEKNCIFITPNEPNDIVWIVTDYDTEKGHVEMYHHLVETLITRLEIQLTAVNESTTHAALIYSKTALSEKGDEALKEFTKESYDIMMDSWEKAMNYYLKTGKMLTGLPNF